MMAGEYVRIRKRPTYKEGSPLTGGQSIPTGAEVTAALRDHMDPDAIDSALNDAMERGGSVNMEDAFPDPARDPNGRMKAIGDMAEGRYRGQHDSWYQKEYRLKFLHRMLMRNLPTDLICQTLKIGAGTVAQMRRELTDRLRTEARKVDPYAHYGSTLAFYNEVRGLALRMAIDGKVANGVKVAALNAALQAEADKHRFLQVAGFYDHARFVPEQGTKDEHVSPLAQMALLIEHGNDIAQFGEEAHAARLTIDPDADPDDDLMSVIG